MKKKSLKKLNMLLLSVAMLFFITLIGITSGVLFSSNVPTKWEITTGKLESLESSVSELNIYESGTAVNYAGQTLVFDKAGDRHSVDLKLTNNSSQFLRYYYKITLSTESSGLESAVLVYYDDIFVGTLSSIFYNATDDNDQDIGILAQPSYVAPAGCAFSTVKNKLTFELHMAAEEGFYKNKKVEIIVTSYVSTHNYQKEFFVENESDFWHAINDINTGIADAKIILGDNITLTQNHTYYIIQPVTIELLGSSINFNGASVVLKGQGMYTLTSAFGTSTPSIGSGGFIIDSQQAFLDIHDFDKGGLYASQVHIKAYDSESTTSMLLAQASKQLQYGIKGGETKQLFFANNFYFSAGAFEDSQNALSATYADTSQPIDNGNIRYANTNTATNKTEKTYLTHIKIGGQRLDIKVLGNDDENIKQSILENELIHIPSASGDILDNISHDLYLPISIKEKNATIEWQSSNIEYINNNGKIGKDLEGDTRIVLTATIKINNSVFVESFEFVVYTLDNAKRFAYFLAFQNPWYMKNVHEYKYLPVVNALSGHDYRKGENNENLDIGLESLEYTIGSEYHYISLIKEPVGNNYDYKMGLNQAVFYTYAQVEVHAKFLKGKTTEFDGIINIIIELGDKTELHDLVYNYIGGEMEDFDVLENILSTREQYGMALEKGDFTMPRQYMNFEISYYADSVSANSGMIGINEGSGIISNITYDDELAHIHIDATKFFASESDIPLYVEIYNPTVQITKVRILYFNTPGAIHNDEKGFYDKSVFESVKYQVYQQLPEAEQGGESGFSDSGDTVRFESIKDYILIRDIEKTSKLVFQTYDGDVLMQVLNWASSTINTGHSLNQFMAGNAYPSNGKSYILDEEESAIRDYMEHLVTGKSGIDKAEWLTFWDNLWAENIWIDDTGMIIGYPSKITALGEKLGSINSYVSATGVTKGNAEFKFRELLAWATNLQDFGDTNSPAEPRIKGGSPNSGIVGMRGNDMYHGWVVRDGLTSISTTYTIPRGTITSGGGTWQTYNANNAIETGGEKAVIDYYFHEILNGGSGSSYATNYNDVMALWNGATIYPKYYKDNGKTNIYRGVMSYLQARLDIPDYKAVYQTLLGSTDIDDALTRRYTSDDPQSNNPHKYTYITSLDASTDGLKHFTNLTTLKVLNSDDVGNYSKLSLFSRPETLAAFFDKLTLLHPNLHTLSLRGVAHKGEAELNLKNITRLKHLTNIDISYNTGIAMLGEVANLSNLSELEFLDIRHIKSDEAYDLDYYNAMLTYIKMTATGASIKYLNNSNQDFALSGDSARDNAYYALALLNDLDYFAGEYLQLAQKIYTDIGQDIIWQLEEGNPISEMINMAEKSGISGARDIAVAQGEYYYVRTRFSSDGTTYTANRMYRLNSNGLTNTAALTVSATTYSTLASLRSASNGYYLYTGPHDVYNNTVFLQNSIIRRDGTGTSNISTYYTGATQLTSSNVASVLASRTETRYYRYTGPSTENVIYYRNQTQSTFNFVPNTVYAISYNTTGATMSAVTANNVPANMSDLINNANAGTAPHTINNYYFYKGANVTINGVLYTSNSYYRLVWDTVSGSYKLSYINKVETYATYGGDTGFVSIPINYNNTTDVGKFYQPLELGDQYNWTFEPYGIYTVSPDLVNGGYYLKKFGAAEFVAGASGTVLRLKNDRYYPNEGVNYGGTGGSEEVILTASIKVGNNVYTRKFSVLVVG